MGTFCVPGQQRTFFLGDAAALQGLRNRAFVDLHLAVRGVLRGVDCIRHRRACNTVGKSLQRGHEEHDERSGQQSKERARVRAVPVAMYHA